MYCNCNNENCSTNWPKWLFSFIVWFWILQCFIVWNLPALQLDGKRSDLVQGSCSGIQIFRGSAARWWASRREARFRRFRMEFWSWKCMVSACWCFGSRLPAWKDWAFFWSLSVYLAEAKLDQTVRNYSNVLTTVPLRVSFQDCMWRWTELWNSGSSAESQTKM